MDEVIARLERIDERIEQWRVEVEGLTDEQRIERALAEGFRERTELRSAQITDLMVGALQALGAEILDGREQIRANTQAVLRLLDERFGPEAPPA
jgi:hypothetical protein